MKNQTVLITGASRGIGKAIANTFINKGHDSILVCKNDISRMDSLYNAATCKNLKCIRYSCDISSYEDVCRLFNDLNDKNISVDILINNAGISYVGLLQDMSISDWQNTINTNLSSAFYFSKFVIPHMLKNGAGKIINISSVWGICGASCEVAYSASKGGLNAFTKALAKELAPSNIQVNALACGLINTDMNSHLSPDDICSLKNEIPAGRMGNPEEIADFTYGLVTSNNYITGQIINIDGGWI